MGAAHDILDSTTIVAVSTPAGRGGIGVVRLSGPDARQIAEQLAAGALQPRVATYRILHDQQGKRLDDAVITYFGAPHSYTGEDVVEVSVHGSPVVLDWLVRAAVSHGAQPARAGEFTERAFLHGRLDLTQAEAVRDLIEAQTLGQVRLAAEQMGGSIAALVRPTKQMLVELIAALEAGIDFAEDDIDVLPPGVIRQRIAALLPPLRALLATFAHGRLLREGMRLAIVGKPNAGKSSLFNRLVEHDRAIVTAMPGTTRDVIAESISLDGIPVELLDTAGLRETADEAERLGVERSRQAMAEADAILLVVDAEEEDAGGSGVDAPLLESLRNRPVLVAYNKIDRAPRARPKPAAGWTAVLTSALTGEGIAELRTALLQLARSGEHTSGSATLTNLRQQKAVTSAKNGLERATDAVAAAVPHEMLLLDLYDALRALDDLTGQTTPDDVLELIFSSFCIGK